MILPAFVSHPSDSEGAQSKLSVKDCLGVLVLGIGSGNSHSVGVTSLIPLRFFLGLGSRLG